LQIYKNNHGDIMKKLTLLKSIALALTLSFSASNAIADENTKPVKPAISKPIPPPITLPPGHLCGDDPTMPEFCLPKSSTQPFSDFIKLIKDSIQELGAEIRR
jgi:hypothetical protein